MKVSAKGRYGLAAMISISQSYTAKEYITVSSIAEKLGISKIYLEQVFSQLKRAGLVSSVKGAQRGYRWQERQSGSPHSKSVATENSLLEKPEKTVARKSRKSIDHANCRFQASFQSDGGGPPQITLYDLVTETSGTGPIPILCSISDKK